MVVFSLYYSRFAKIGHKKNIYPLAYRQCNTVCHNHNPCIMIHILLPDYCQYTALFKTGLNVIKGPYFKV